MRRPTRTRRLSIAAIVSVLALMVVAGAYVLSYGDSDGLFFGTSWIFGLRHGRFIYSHQVISTGNPQSRWMFDFVIWGFGAVRGGVHNMSTTYDIFTVSLPLWFPLLLLLIAPVRWLIARPAHAPAFPVITDAKQLK